jgi:hypothetical protein
MADDGGVGSEAHAPEQVSSQQGKGGITADSPYALNVERVTNLVSGKMLYGHQGMAYGAVHGLFFDPEKRRGMALLTTGASEARRGVLADMNHDMLRLFFSQEAQNGSGR